MSKCFSCSEKKTGTILTWFYTDQKLVKKPLCRKCVDNEDYDFYGPKDMYTADEVCRRIRNILNNIMVETDEYTMEDRTKFLKKVNQVFKPTVDQEELNINE